MKVDDGFRPFVRQDKKYDRLCQCAEYAGNDEDAKRSDSNIFAIYKNQLIVVVLKLGEDGISDRLQNAVDGRT